MANAKKKSRKTCLPGFVAQTTAYTGDEPLSSGRTPRQIIAEFSDEWMPLTAIENRKKDIALHCDLQRKRCHQTKSDVRAKFRRPTPIGNSSTVESDLE
jgi:hypothetical protein